MDPEPAERQKRRLPAWMSGVAVGDQARESENENGSNENSQKDKLVSQGCHPKSKTKSTHRAKISLLPGKESVDTRPWVLEKCGKSRRTKVLSEQDAGCDSSFNKSGSKRKKHGAGRTVRKPTSRKSGKAVSIASKSEGAEITSTSEGDEDLTMEDLMNIAEEYVQAGVEVQLQEQKSSSRACMLESQLPSTASSKSEPGDFHGTDKSSLDGKEPTYNSAEKSVFNPGKTGDPGQDMLDLYLGPLLRKPTLDDQMNGSLSEDMKFELELKKLSQNNIAEERIPLVKKKSSLKDKVAMLLD